MVAIGGIGWSLAPSLKAYVDEADAAYPGRDHSSDGSIGDQAHAARTSDHNPYDGWVHAVDLDEDLAPGLDLKDFAKRLLKSRDPRIRYVIYEGQIFKSYVSSTGPAWTWLPYTGPNSHSHHLHLSINRTAAARNDMRPWGIKPPAAPTSEEDDDMAAQIAWYVGEPVAGKPTTNHAYLVTGGIGKHLNGAGLNLCRALKVHEIDTPLDKTWRGTVALLDGPLRNIT